MVYFYAQKKGGTAISLCMPYFLAVYNGQND